jgi:hypothetical protein
LQEFLAACLLWGSGIATLGNCGVKAKKCYRA